MKKIVLFLLALIPFAAFAGNGQTVTTTDGVELYVKVEGSGPHCLVVHGGPGAGSYWLEKFAGDFFEQHFTMVYLDQRGMGRSSSPANGDYSLKRVVEDFEQVRRHLNIDKWLTMGHSFGGILQMGYIERFPAVVEGMMMFNCTLYMEESFKNGWFAKTEELLGPEESLFLKDATLSAHDKLMTAAQKLNDKGLRWKIFYSEEKNFQIMGETFGDIPNFNQDFGNIELPPEYSEDFRSNAATVKIPVLFFYGKSDWSIGPEHYKGINFPNMLLWGSDVGHTPFLENKEDLEKAVIAFIEKWSF